MIDHLMCFILVGLGQRNEAGTSNMSSSFPLVGKKSTLNVCYVSHCWPTMCTVPRLRAIYHLGHHYLHFLV